MRIGILTFHRAVNYGAVLQAWALQTFLQNKGYDAGILDYRCKAIEENYKLLSKQKFLVGSLLHSIKYALSRIFHFKAILNRKKSFNTFINNRLSLLRLQEVKDLSAIITGSDQVWNPFLTGGVNDYYFLNIEDFCDKNKIAYAVSGEIKYINDSYVEQIAPMVAKIPNISVRESNLKQVLRIPNAKVCVDPTFLLTFEEWETIGQRQIVEGDYIFLFEVIPSPLSPQITDFLARKMGLKIIFLNSGFRFLKRNSNLKTQVGPEDFVSLIRYASFVVTTSFHGMALSMLLRKQFVLSPTKNMNRQNSLLKEVGLEDRVIDNTDKLQNINDIAYTDDMFVQLSQSSKEFLISSLNHDKAI